MKNRYGDEYNFLKLDENSYTIEGNLKHWRMAAKENCTDWSDLEFVDPSGGPFIQVGHYEIDGRKVSRITAMGPNFIFEVEDDTAV
jgi:hypothetical protein